MTQEEKIQYWIKISDNDLKAAEIMLNNQQYLYSCFMCQQVAEKMIKGYFTKAKENAPPHIHALITLAERSGLYELLSEEQIDLLEELDPFNIQARYPDYKDKMAKSLTYVKAERVFLQTKEFLEWTKKKIFS